MQLASHAAVERILRRTPEDEPRHPCRWTSRGTSGPKHVEGVDFGEEALAFCSRVVREENSYPIVKNCARNLKAQARRKARTGWSTSRRTRDGPAIEKAARVPISLPMQVEIKRLDDDGHRGTYIPAPPRPTGACAPAIFTIVAALSACASALPRKRPPTCPDGLAVKPGAAAETAAAGRFILKVTERPRSRLLELGRREPVLGATIRDVASTASPPLAEETEGAASTSPSLLRLQLLRLLGDLPL